MKNTYTIFGDSIAKGIIFENNKIANAEKNTVKYLEEEYNISIENNSKYGQSLKRLIDKGEIEKYIENLDKTKENYVIFSIGGNDADFDWKSVAENPVGHHESKTPLKQFSQLLNNSIKKLQENGVKVFLATIMPVHSEKFFKNVISHIADKNKVLQFFGGDVTNINRVQECFNVEIVKSAIRNNCPLLDVRTKMLCEPKYLDYFCEDGIHPNNLGYKKLAQFCMDEIEFYKQNKTYLMKCLDGFSLNECGNINSNKCVNGN